MDKLDDLLKQLLEDVASGEEIKLGDIPDIELYMDQVTTFIDRKLEYLKRSDHDKILTSTMINNYTKARILMPPNKKRYSREHIMLLIMIYNLKQTLPISDIEALFKPLNNSKEFLPLEDIYSAFFELKQDLYSKFGQMYADKLPLIRKATDSIEDEEIKTKADMFLTVILLITQANAQKKLAEKIIDRYFNE